MSHSRILIVGGYGTFGGRLSRLLTQNTKHDVFVAGRSKEKARKHCDEFGGIPTQLNREDITADFLRSHGINTLVDASGPFSLGLGNPFACVEACLMAQTHYIDLSDDSAFTLAVEQFAASAQKCNIIVCSGASSVPGISGTIAKSIAPQFQSIEFIESTILPGNRAPRGLSVMQSILHQAGRPISSWQNGQRGTTPGWSKPRRVRIAIDEQRMLSTRWSVLVSAPDIEIFPRTFAAENVSVRAGLELTLLQFGLSLLAWLPRLGLIRTLRPFAPALRRVAELFEPFGTDEGGMLVTVGGRAHDGRLLETTWSLHVGSGDGPFIPALCAFILCKKLSNGMQQNGVVRPHDRLSISDLEEGLALVDAKTNIRTTRHTSLFEQALRDDWYDLSPSVQQFHSTLRSRAFKGVANVTRGTSFGAKLIATIFRFPKSAYNIPVSVVINRYRDRETWHRRFGASGFTSHLTLAQGNHGLVIERFGAFSFAIALDASQSLRFPVVTGRFLGIPIPKPLLPISRTTESQNQAGHFSFSIELSVPFIGLIVAYKGYLVSVMDHMNQQTRPDTITR